MPVKLTMGEWIIRAREIHGDKFDYSKVNYKGTEHKIIIICPIHGDFEQTPKGHLKSRTGCFQCGRILAAKNTTKSLEKIIERFRLKHGDKFDYSKAIYKSTKHKIIIICPIHGDFEQTPSEHCHCGCGECGRIATRLKLSKSTDDFIAEAKLKHGEVYLYTKTKYNGARRKLIITCRIHGDFTQAAGSHLSGCGCKLCASAKLNNTVSYSYIYFKNNPDKKAMECTLYLMKFDNPSSSYYKIGISINVSVRGGKLRRDTKSHMIPIILHETTLFQAFLLEQHFLQMYPSFKPPFKFNGSTECLTLTVPDIDEIHKYLYESTATQ